VPSENEFDFAPLFPERKPRFSDRFDPAAVRGRRVLVTGAAGSIGSALTRRIIAAHPEKLVLLDHSEPALQNFRRMLAAEGIAESFPGSMAASTRILLTDVRDDFAMETLFAQEQPEIIFHAAAFKHVPLLEKDLFAAIENNALATWRLAEKANRYGAKKLLLISTDKAANPRSMLGASKRLAELAVLRWNSLASRMSAVRLGNVAGSSGSVLPIFREQIANGGPVTVTDPEVTRYFLTMPETCSVIGAIANLENSSGLFVPDMGEPIAILSIAERMISLSAARVSSRITIEFTGLRPGDKLKEDLLSSAEEFGDEVFRGIYSIAGPPLISAWAERIDAQFRQLAEITEQRDSSALAAVLRAILPEYVPASTRNNTSSSFAAAGAAHD
jgi:FlaA1/EpsC-like NDP-sugar epimerase